MNLHLICSKITCEELSAKLISPFCTPQESWIQHLGICSLHRFDIKQSLAPVSTKAFTSFSLLNLRVKNSASSPISLLAGPSTAHSSMVGWTDPSSSFPTLCFRLSFPYRPCKYEFFFLSGDF